MPQHLSTRNEWNFSPKGAIVSQDERGVYRLGSLPVATAKAKKNRAQTARPYKRKIIDNEIDVQSRTPSSVGLLKDCPRTKSPSSKGNYRPFSAEERVEARLLEASTKDGRQALMTRIAEYRTLTGRPKTNYLILNKRVPLPHERISHLRQIRTARESRRCEVDEARRRLEKKAVEALSLHTRDNEQTRKLRSVGTAITLARLTQQEKTNRDCTWMTGLLHAAFATSALDIIKRHRTLVLHLETVRASALVAKFIRRALRRKALNHATDLLKHISNVLGAQTEFRRACRKLVKYVVLVQRFYRRRDLITRARMTLLLRQWHRFTLTQQEASFNIPAAVRLRLLKDFIRERRQDYVLKRIVFEQYDLRPALIEASVAASKARTISRREARTKIDTAKKFGYIFNLARKFDILKQFIASSNLPRLHILASKEELSAMNTRALSSQTPLALPTEETAFFLDDNKKS